MIPLALLRKHWRKLVVVGALAGAFAGGYLSAGEGPPEVRIEERVVFKDRLVTVEKLVEVQAKAARTVVYRDRIVKPDGTRIEREVERSDTTTVVAKGSEKASERTAELQATTVTTETPVRPRWRAGILVGIDTREVFGPPLVGIIVERRLIGGLSAGAWVMNPGSVLEPSVGVSLSYQF